MRWTNEPELPVVLQYYYKVSGCPAYDARNPECICWHDEGTGPLKDETHTAPRYAHDWRIRRGYPAPPNNK